MVYSSVLSCLVGALVTLVGIKVGALVGVACRQIMRSLAHHGGGMLYCTRYSPCSRSAQRCRAWHLYRVCIAIAGRKSAHIQLMHVTQTTSPTH